MSSIFSMSFTTVNIENALVNENFFLMAKIKYPNRVIYIYYPESLNHIIIEQYSVKI